jgi:1-acyl-sn-glycerol-3-phosphate acyltransferase
MTDIAWHGDVDLVPHLLGVIGIGSIDAVVAFGTPIAIGPGADRKAIATAAEAEVRRMVRSVRARRNTRRTPETAAAAPILSAAERG